MSDSIRQPPGNELPTDSTVIELWYASVSAGRPGRLEQHCERWLNADERARADEFRRLTSRNQHVVGRGMARRLLSRPGVPPQSIRLDQSPLGKPFVAEPLSAQRPFNIAHTDRLAVCAVAPRPELAAAVELLGVDVERSGRRTDPELARRFFSRPEYEWLTKQLNRACRQESFLRIWTLKESFIKAIGTGLQTPLADFAFVDVDSTSPRIQMLNPKLNDDRSWSFFLIQPRAGFIASVALATTENAPSFRVLTRRFEEVLDD